MPWSDLLVPNDTQYIAEFAFILVHAFVQDLLSSFHCPPYSSFSSNSPHSNVDHFPRSASDCRCESYERVLGDVGQ
jgi:hypothetical protein